MHKKPGYILFLMFSILSICSVILSLYFSQATIYRRLMTLLITQEKTRRLAFSGIALAETILTVEPEKKDTQEDKGKSKQPFWQTEFAEQKIYKQFFPFLNTLETYTLSEKTDPIQAKIFISMQSEQGKLNLNSLYDFETKKFIKEGQAGDRKKLCIWVFDRIASITKKPSLFSAFEKHLATRSADFNDVTELLAIKEFANCFDSLVFFNPDNLDENHVFLTDIFTIYSEQDTINPWLFSHSWCQILSLKPKKNFSDEEKKRFFNKIVPSVNNWSVDWNNRLKDFYQKEYQNLAQEIKTILTTQFEANIFSLLLKANIGETSSTIFTIVQSKTKKDLISFDIIKTYQL